MGKKDKAAEEKEFQAQLELKTAETAVLNLDTDEIPVLTKCTAAIYQFIGKDVDTNAPLIHEMGAIEKLLNLIGTEDVTLRRYSLQTIAIMCGQQLIKYALARSKDRLLPKLFSIIVGQDQIATEFSLMILSSMSSVSKIKDDFIEDERMDDLVALFKYVDPDIKKHTLLIILNLTNDFQVRDTLIEYSQTIIEYCLVNMTSEYKTIQELSLEIIFALSGEKQAFDVFLELNGINRLFLFIQDKEYLDLHEKALKTFESIWKREVYREAFIQDGSFEKMIENTAQILETPEGERSALILMEVIHNTNFKLNKLALIPVTLDLVTKLIQSPNDDLKVSTLKGVTVLAQHASFREMFNDQGLTQKVVDLISNETTKKYAVLACAQLFKDNSSRIQPIGQSQSSTFIQLLSTESDHDLIVGVLSILVVLGVDDEPYQKEILDLGLLQCLTVQFNSTVFLVNLMDVLKIYVKTIEGTKVLISNNVLLKIISLLAANHVKVRTKAAKLIQQLTSNSFVFEYLFNHNAIELLIKVNKSDHLRSHSSQEALSCLLEFNLSYKYALERYVAQTNHIGDGFYDCGYQMYDTLEKLTQNTKPVILIKLKPEKEEIPEEVEIIKISTANEDTQSKKSDKSTKKGKSKKKGKSDDKEDKKEKEEKIKAKENSQLAPPDFGRTTSKLEIRTPENDESTTSIQEPSKESEFDLALGEFLEQINRSLEDEKDRTDYTRQIEIIACLIADRFGGKKTENYATELAQIQRSRESPIIPLGQICIGVHRERALLFKLVCDIHSIPVTLNRGDYGKVWNSFYMENKQFIVDLMNKPGKILEFSSTEAIQYISFG